MDEPDSGEISQQTLALAAEAEREAASFPSAEEIRDLAEQAIRHGGALGMNDEQTAELREIADQAVEAAEKMADLVRRVRDRIRADAPPPEEVPG
jgi:3-methyladenine DNA glycosylase/8-oxoguanine DNA glycosylase